MGIWSTFEIYASASIQPVLDSIAELVKSQRETEWVSVTEPMTVKTKEEN